MSKNLLKGTLFLTAALSSVVSGPAVAQDADDIVVTARRTEERLQDVPISIAVFNQEQLDDLNITSATDLAAVTPSLQAEQRYGAETASFAIRGFRQEQNTSPSVGVYFADVIAPRAQGSIGGGNGAGPGQLFDLQNVQVLRGPQGTLFGRNTTGGAILVVPQRPNDEVGGYLEASAGDYDMYRVQGVFNTPVGDQARLRLGFDRQERDGYMTNRSPIGPSDFNDVDYLAARASFIIDFTPTLENYTIVSYSQSNTNGQLGRVAAANCVSGNPPTGCLGPFASLAQAQIDRATARGDGYYDGENNTFNPHSDIQQWGAFNTTTWTVSDNFTIKNIASYQRFTQGQQLPIFSEYFAPSMPGGVNQIFTAVYQDPGRDNVSQQTFTEELQFQGTAGALTYQFGGYYEKSTPLNGYQGALAPVFTVCSGVPTPSVSPTGPTACTGLRISHNLNEYVFENSGIYAQGTYDFNEQLSLTLGARYTQDKTTGRSLGQSLLGGSTASVVCIRRDSNGVPIPSSYGEDPACFTEDSVSSEEPTWVAGIDYRPAEDVLIYGKYSRGYRQGSLNAALSVPFSWDPESVDAYEIGLKTSFDGPVPGYLNVAVFYNDFSDQQLAANLTPCYTAVPGNPPCPIDLAVSSAQGIVNAGESKIQGVELDAGLQLFEGLDLRLSYTYLDTELVSYSAPAVPGYHPPRPSSVIGGALAFSPEHKLTVGVSYTLPLSDNIGEVSFGATYIYTAEQIAASDSILGELPESNVLNLNAEWASILNSPVDLSVFVTNATDEEYPVGVGGAWVNTGFESYFLAPPRMVGARLRYSFGGER